MQTEDVKVGELCSECVGVLYSTACCGSMAAGGSFKVDLQVLSTLPPFIAGPGRPNHDQMCITLESRPSLRKKNGRGNYLVTRNPPYQGIGRLAAGSCTKVQGCSPSTRLQTEHKAVPPEAERPRAERARGRERVCKS